MEIRIKEIERLEYLMDHCVKFEVDDSIKELIKALINDYHVLYYDNIKYESLLVDFYNDIKDNLDIGDD